jgi:hypothetical protein
MHLTAFDTAYYNISSSSSISPSSHSINHKHSEAALEAIIGESPLVVPLAAAPSSIVVALSQPNHNKLNNESDSMSCNNASATIRVQS